MPNKTFDLKQEIKLEDVMYLDPKLIVVLGHLMVFCHKEKVPCVISSLMTDSVEGRVSLTHKEGRAADVSIFQWKDGKAEKCVDYLEKKAGEYGAISASDGQQRLAIKHNIFVRGKSLGSHIHIQVYPGDQPCL